MENLNSKTLIKLPLLNIGVQHNLHRICILCSI